MNTNSIYQNEYLSNKNFKKFLNKIINWIDINLLKIVLNFLFLKINIIKHLASEFWNETKNYFIYCIVLTPSRITSKTVSSPSSN